MCDLVSSRSLFVRFISSKDQVANTFTKPLPMAKFVYLQDNLNIWEVHLRLQGCIERKSHSPPNLSHAVTTTNEDNVST